MEIPRVMQTKFPQTVMVFGCVSSEGDVMPPHFFREGLRLNSDGYVELLNTVVKPWITRIANGRPYVWQQDSAPCHTGLLFLGILQKEGLSSDSLLLLKTFGYFKTCFCRIPQKSSPDGDKKICHI